MQLFLRAIVCFVLSQEGGKDGIVVRALTVKVRSIEDVLDVAEVAIVMVFFSLFLLVAFNFLKRTLRHSPWTQALHALLVSFVGLF